jgi:hypothetical protein
MYADGARWERRLAVIRLFLPDIAVLSHHSPYVKIAVWKFVETHV